MNQKPNDRTALYFILEICSIAFKTGCKPHGRANRFLQLCFSRGRSGGGWLIMFLAAWSSFSGSLYCWHWWLCYPQPRWAAPRTSLLCVQPVTPWYPGQHIQTEISSKYSNKIEFSYHDISWALHQSPALQTVCSYFLGSNVPWGVRHTSNQHFPIPTLNQRRFWSDMLTKLALKIAVCRHLAAILHVQQSVRAT